MKWHVITRVGINDNFIPDIPANEPRLYIGFDRPHDPKRMRENVINELHRKYGNRPSAAATDLLYLAMTIYAADLSIPRSMTDDNWTRDIIVHVPVSENANWIRSNDTLIKMISFLTGDIWSFEFRQRTSDAIHHETVQVDAFAPTMVSLFSGGMDSLVGAMDLLETRERLALVMHYGGGMTKTFQKSVLDAMMEENDELLSINAFHVLPPLIKNNVGERTMRSRSILFIALGLTAADICGIDTPVYIPENGLISLNVPLTSARDGSASTRTTHPYFISLFRQLLLMLNLNHPLLLPYRFMTKGEMLRQVENQEMLARIIPFSMSCAHVEAGRWQGGASDRHCGYCIPCIIRQAAVYAAGVTDGPMALDIINHVPNPRKKKGEDYRAIKIALSRLRSRSENRLLFDVLDSGPIDPDELENYVSVYCRGMEEVRSFLEQI